MDDNSVFEHLCNGSYETLVSELTRILERVQQGDPRAGEELLPLVYEQLRKLAAARMANEAAGHTLQPTALVHEAWLRLSKDPDACWEDRGHFFAAAAEAMRRILVENARRKLALKRNAGRERVPLEELTVAATADDETVALINDALDLLTAEDPGVAELIKLRFFVGLTHEEAARALGLSERSARRDWAFGRTWLFREINRMRGSKP